MKISASITDFPLQTSIETFFREFKAIGVDSVEIALGAKTKNISAMMTLSQKYHLPIASFHQSPWSGFGLSFDTQLIKMLHTAGITTGTFHPVTFCGFDTKRMENYFTTLQELQKQYGITVCLENMPNEIFYKKLFPPELATMEAQLEKTDAVAKQYGFFLTFDTSHAQFAQPHKTESFLKIFPRVRNIHLSSFTKKQEHLPLDTGNLDIGGFLTFLKSQKYPGLLTFEINYSLLRRILINYDFSEIERSVALLKRYL